MGTSDGAKIQELKMSEKIYQNNDFINTKTSLTSCELEKVERLLGFLFPASFRRHYLAYNGGQPQKKLFRKTADEAYIVHEFLPIKYGQQRTLFEDAYRHLKIDQKLLPEYFVPFAVDPGGDFYCFSIRDHDNGSIWLWAHEFYDDPDKSITFLADSLKDFVEQLTVLE
jgi:hypothetical protein